jgi:hypothetical protein
MQKELDFLMWIYNIENKDKFIEINLFDFQSNDHMYRVENIERNVFHAYVYRNSNEPYLHWNFYEYNGFWVAIRHEYNVNNAIYQWCMNW